MPGVLAFAKEDIPDRYHYKNNPLIKDILVISDGDGLIEQDPDYPENYVPHPKGGSSVSKGEKGELASSLG